MSARSCDLALIFFRAIRPSPETSDSVPPSQLACTRESHIGLILSVTSSKSKESTMPVSLSIFETRRISTAPPLNVRSKPRIVNQAPWLSPTHHPTTPIESTSQCRPSLENDRISLMRYRHRARNRFDLDRTLRLTCLTIRKDPASFEPLRLTSAHYRLENLYVPRTATEVSGQTIANFGFVGIWIPT
jgi:hypothetical protein